MQYLSRANVAPVIGEFFGTATLVMVALALSQITSVSYFVATSIAVALGLMYMLFANLTGGHFNPAITFGLWTARKVGTVRGVSYIVAQVVGGLGSWALYQYLTNQKLAGHANNWDWRIFVGEVVGTLVLAVGFGALVTRGFGLLESALTYGASLFTGVMIAATTASAVAAVSDGGAAARTAAGYLNPAVAIGSHNFEWVYVLGPLVGALVGINLYLYVFGPAPVAAATRAAKAKVTVKRSSTKKKK